MDELDEDDVCIIEYYLRDLLTDPEPELSPSPDGVGMKAHINELFEDEYEDEVTRTFIQIYAQSSLFGKPKDTTVGFTSADVTSHHGIVIADVRERVDPPVYSGEVFTVDTFFEKYPLTEKTKRKVVSMLDKLKYLAAPTEAWLEQASSIYMDRMVGFSTIDRPRNYC